MENLRVLLPVAVSGVALEHNLVLCCSCAFSCIDTTWLTVYTYHTLSHHTLSQAVASLDISQQCHMSQQSGLVQHVVAM